MVALGILAIPLVIAYYFYLPKVGAKLLNVALNWMADNTPRLMTNVAGLLTQSLKMSALSAKGVASRQLTAEVMAAVAEVDPLKAFAMPMIENAVGENFGKAYQGIAAQILGKINVNFTKMAQDFLSSRYPQLSEQLKALEVVSNREKA